MCNSVKIMYCINGDILGLFLHSIKVTYHTDSFMSVDPFSNSRNKSHLVIEYNPFNILLPFAHILLRILTSIFIKDICNFLIMSLPGFGISVKVFKIHSRCKTKSYNPNYKPKYEPMLSWWLSW